MVTRAVAQKDQKKMDKKYLVRIKVVGEVSFVVADQSAEKAQVLADKVFEEDISPHLGQLSGVYGNNSS